MLSSNQPTSFCFLAAQGALTGHEDPSSILVLVEGGQLLLYDLTATTRQPPAAAPPPPQPPFAARLSEQRSGSPNKQRLSTKQPPQQQQQQLKELPPPPPPVQQLFKGQLQGKPLVTAARLRMIPIQPVPLRGLQVGWESQLAWHYIVCLERSPLPMRSDCGS
jgi:hypothetical protein